MLNLTGMLRAPAIEQQPEFVATYSAHDLRRVSIKADSRSEAMTIAAHSTPAGYTLTNLRQRKNSGRTTAKRPSLAERVDVSLTRALHGIYSNTEIAARFALDELRTSARGT